MYGDRKESENNTYMRAETQVYHRPKLNLQC